MPILLAPLRAGRYARRMSFQRPRSLSDLVADHLRDEIVSGALPADAALSEAAIAKRLEVSRTPVREAFARLELEGLVRAEPQRGTFVFSTDDEEMAALCDARAALETGALRLAMARDGAGLSARLSALLDRMEAARSRGDLMGYLAEDAAFHDAIVESAANAYLSAAYRTIAPKMAALRTRMAVSQEIADRYYADHACIRDLAAAGDAPGAEAALTRHIGRGEGSFWSF